MRQLRTLLLAISCAPAIFAATSLIPLSIDLNLDKATDLVTARSVEGSTYEVREVFYGSLSEGERLTLDVPLGRSRDCTEAEYAEVTRRAQAGAAAFDRAARLPDGGIDRTPWDKLPEARRAEIMQAALEAAPPAPADAGPVPRTDSNGACTIGINQELHPGLELMLFLQRDGAGLRVSDVVWSDTPEENRQHRDEAKAAAADRRGWESALLIEGPSARFNALWPWVKKPHYNGHAIHELAKLGAFAGARIGEKLPAMSKEEREDWVRRAGELKIEKLRAPLWAAVAQEEATFDAWLAKNPEALAAWRLPIQGEYWTPTTDPPAQFTATSKALSSSISGLTGFTDGKDLPRQRELAIWLARRRFPFFFEDFFNLFKAKPSPDNLPAIEAISQAALRDNWANSGVGFNSSRLCNVLRDHPYPGSVAILAPYLEAAGPGYAKEIEALMTQWTASDLGPASRPWLEWARKHGAAPDP